MRKPRQTYARPIAALVGPALKDAFARQGFASTELVTRWAEIAGAEIAAHSQPEKIQWPRPIGSEAALPGTLVLRVEGPMALEIQHMAGVVLERVNRFFGWQAVAELRLRQAPLARRLKPRPPPGPDPAITAEIAATLTDIRDDKLRAALARLGASIGPGEKD
jgi:hypothetical protein